MSGVYVFTHRCECLTINYATRASDGNNEMMSSCLENTVVSITVYCHHGFLGHRFFAIKIDDTKQNSDQLEQVMHITKYVS